LILAEVCEQKRVLKIKGLLAKVLLVCKMLIRVSELMKMT